ncbi:unnamed protein product [Diatraea saccharalis]|uniref:xanthine dehydrogenase n=1 Tax=Diatraea saccharalis TaxID=40085 RepID=A0A9N9WAH0_9NEOP|nr:unnamed protein product [Diatraea saccharalis]
MEELDSIVPQDAQRQLVFFVNGKKVVEHSPDPEWTLLWYLRKKLHLTGTKYGCGEGGCGACTVMISQYLKDRQDVRHIAVNACLTPVCAMHGLAVTTVEGIGTAQERLHPVQERIAKAHGSQCGFCTPGIVMSMYTLLRYRRKIEYVDIETALQGNLCRCTGYRPIIDGFKVFMEGWEKYYFRDDSVPRCSMGRYCCRQRETVTDSALFKKSKFTPYDPTQEPIFPPELKINDRSKEYLYFKGKNVIWIRPTNINELILLKHNFPHSKIVVGNTEIGVDVKFKKKFYKLLISPVNIASMNFCKALDDGILVGAAFTLTELYRFLAKFCRDQPKEGKVFGTIKDMLHWFAGRQVRNVASLVGNIITASPISDLNPILMSTNSILNVCSLSRGNRKVCIDENFFTEYRKTVVEDDEVVLSVEIPFSSDYQHIKAYKQARRRDDDISIVTASFNITFDKNTGDTVRDAKLCFGGMAPTTILAKKSSEFLKGQKWNENMLHELFCSLTQELNLDISVPGGMADYRKSLCLSFFYRFYSYVLDSISKADGNSLTLEILSAINGIPKMIPKSSQYLEIKDKISTSDTVGQPVPHTSAIKQATGEALYCDDVPSIEGELFLCLVFSKEPSAKIISIDASDALALHGVKAFFSAEDLDDECNKMGPIIKDEEIFSRNIVTSRACVIGAIVAISESIARKAKDMVVVIYQRIEPVIITIEDAIMYNSFYPGYKRVLKKGDVKKAFEQYSMTVEGTVRSGAQEHFYLETISAYAIRKEDELEIIATTQNPADIARIASEALQIPNHKITCKVKRIGGGFGGKETRAAILALPVALAAYRLKKPVRAVLDRDEDMQVSGYRHPCLIKYKAAYDGTGKIIAAVFDFYGNAGNSMDISCSMIERAIMHLDNCYFIPNIEVNGYLCKTNMTSNTAFRGFGAPKAMFAAECMIRDIAEALDTDYEDLVAVNLYREGQMTHFNQTLTYCTLRRCWDECIETSKYWERKNEVEVFNRYVYSKFVFGYMYNFDSENILLYYLFSLSRSYRWKKKGIALVPTKYGISFQADFLMQAGALLHVYRDGSVLLSIGGIEMGQGLFTKMIQVATRCLDIDMDKIHISEMSTDKVPNSSPTAGSISSDLYGMAVINACNILNDRLKPYKDDNSAGIWEEWVKAAYLDRIQLTATGYYAAPKIEYDPKSNKGNLYEYFTYGVACSEVLIDCLTGDHRVLRTDIVMDLGESLNPAIDIGQIEGAFMQGYGFYTMEEMLFSPSGEALTRGPGTYKIPSISDIPKEFNVSLLKGAPNPRAVYSSKVCIKFYILA